MPEPYLPLRGVTVLAWEQAVSLPMTTRLLADLGASVIRLEAPSRGQPRPRALGNDLARNKLGLALNLRDPRGQELFKRLVRRVDIVCENFTPRVKRQYGLTYDALTQVKPDLIMLSLCGYGQTGRMAERPTFGPGIEAASGHAQLTGNPDQPPMRPGTIVFADNISGFYAAFAIAGALLRRRLTGKGQYIDLAMLEACAYHLAPSLALASLTRQNPPRRGNDEPAALVQGVYEANAPERWVAVTVWPEQRGALAFLLGGAADGEALARFVKARSAEDAVEQLQGVGIAASIALDARDLLLNPQLGARDAFTLVRHDWPVNGYAAHPHAASPFRFAGRPRPDLHEAPLPGQDSREVLRELAGLSEADVDRLVGDGIVALPATPSGPAELHPDPESVRRRLAWRLIAGYDPHSGRTLGLPAAEEVRA